MSSTNTPQNPPHLLTLPLEIRHHIFHHLSRNSPRSYPFRGTATISSVDQLGPPPSLLVTCRALFDQIQDYYYRKATFSILSEVCIPFRSKMTPPLAAAIRHMRKVEFVFVWNVFPRQVKPPLLRTWMVHHVGLLRDLAPYLHTVTISVRGEGQEHGRDVRKTMLEPFEELRGRVHFKLGVIYTIEESEDELRQELQGYLDKLNQEQPNVSSSTDFLGTGQDPCMLSLASSRSDVEQ
jgi:hypothetical protein